MIGIILAILGVIALVYGIITLINGGILAGVLLVILGLFLLGFIHPRARFWTRRNDAGPRRRL